MGLKTPQELAKEWTNGEHQRLYTAAVIRQTREEFAREAAARLKHECDVSTRNAAKDRRHDLATLAYAHALRIVEALARESAEPTRAPEQPRKCQNCGVAHTADTNTLCHNFQPQPAACTAHTPYSAASSGVHSCAICGARL